MKKTLVLFLAMMAVFAFGVCAIELDTAENAAEVVAEDAVLAADASVELKPGLNIYTGTTAVYTFDDETLSGLLIGNGKNGTAPTVATMEKTEGDGNKALALTERDQYVAVPNFATIEADRPILYSLNYIYTGQIRLMATDTYSYSKATYADLDYIYHKPIPAGWQATRTVTRTANVAGGMFKGDYVGADIKQLYLYMYSEIQNDKSTSYIDDISVIPYYKLTYDVNGGTGAEFASTYFYVKDGYPYESVADGSALTKDGKAFAGWALTADATPNDIIDKLYPVPGSDVVLYAVYGEAEKAELKPGLNIFTGTANALTFEGDEKYLSKYLTTGSEVRPMAKGDDADNHMLWFNAGDRYFAVRHFPETEVDRPFQLKIDVYYGGQVRIMNNDVYDPDLEELASVFVDYEGTSDKWYSFNYEIKGTQTDSKKNGGYYRPTWEEYTFDGYGKPFQNLFVYAYNSDTGFDNLSVIPYYKLTYDANGGTGTVPAYEYFLEESGSKYRIKGSGTGLTKDGKYFAGWALTPDATLEDVISYVTVTPGSDVTLYAVYEEAHPTYGKLVYYQNFSAGQGYPAPSYIDATLLANSTCGSTKVSNPWDYFFENCTGTVKEDPENPGSGDMVAEIRGNGVNDYPRLVIAPNLTNVNGKYTFVVDLYDNGDPDTLTYIYDQNGKNNQIHTEFAHNAEGAKWIRNSLGFNAFELRAAENIPADNVISSSNMLGTKFNMIYMCNRGTKVANTSYVMYDNIRIYYNEVVDITYNTNMPEGVTAVNTINVGNVEFKKTTAAEVKDSYLPELNVQGYSFLGWKNEAGEYVTKATKDMTVTAQWQKIKPGLNILTGTTAVVDYEATGNTYLLSEANGLTTIVPNVKKAGGNAVTGNDSAHVLKASAGRARYVTYQMPITTEAGRKYKVTFDNYIYSSTGVSDYGYYTGWILHAKGTNSHVTLTSDAAKNNFKANKWFTNSYDFVAADANQFRFQIKFASDPAEGRPDGVLGSTINNSDIYFDNISVVPYYIINYYGTDGSVINTEQVLADNYVPNADALTWDGEGEYEFLGWATEENATEAVEKVALANEDVDLYPVWQKVADENAPESDSENFSMRAGDKAGMRFYASVTASQRNSAVEYGFVVARADVLEAIGYDNAELKLGLEYKGVGEGKLYVKGAAYTVENDEVTLDKYIEINDEGDYIFAAVCTGIDVTDKTQVTTKFVIRPYLNIGSVYAYGKPVVKSLYEVAQAIDTTELPEELQNYVAAIIATAEAAE